MYGKIGLYVLVGYLAIILIEVTWSTLTRTNAYNLADSIANILIGVGNRLLQGISLAWKYLIFSLVEPFQLQQIPITGVSLLCTFLVAELAYYWHHRLSHEIPALWTVHHTHHSSPWLNFTTAARLHWLGRFISPVFFLPFILVGFSADLMFLFVGLGLIYQILLHTRMIPKLGPLEGLFLNTPSAHRVHHGSNPIYIDRNYGAVLITWDRVFGTYQPETEPVRYGVTTGFVSANPLKIMWIPMWRWMRGSFRREKDLIAEKSQRPDYPGLQTGWQCAEKS